MLFLEVDLGIIIIISFLLDDILVYQSVWMMFILFVSSVLLSRHVASISCLDLNYLRFLSLQQSLHGQYFQRNLHSSPQ
jgi:hypothetical protein